MKQLTMGLVVLLLNGLVLASVGGRVLASGGERSRVVDEDRFEVRNDVRTLEVHVCPDNKKMTLRLEAQLSRGLLTWRLLDPQGGVQAQGEVVPGAAVRENRVLLPTAGRWVLEVTRQGATGTHDIRWDVR